MSDAYGDALVELALAAGIAGAYHDPARGVRKTSRETTEALLRAMGFDCSNEAALRDALGEMRERHSQRILDSVKVGTRAEAELLHLSLPIAQGVADTRNVSAEFELESGELRQVEWQLHDHAARAAHDRLIYDLPTGFTPPLGYHHLRLHLSGRGGESEQRQRLIVVPERCVSARDILGDSRCYGLAVNLYTVRGRHNAGIGNLSAVAELIAVTRANRDTGKRHAEFIGINPLHAPSEAPIDVSPYSPSSRLFRNPLYLDPWSIPELAHSAAAQQRLNAHGADATLERLAGSGQILYADVAAFLLPVLRLLHEVFLQDCADGASERGAQYASYRRARGELLDRFATYQAMAGLQRTSAGGDTLASWREWPAQLRNPSLVELSSFASAHEREVDFHRYLQFELDRQLASAQSSLKASGMRIGLGHDLALSSSPGGFDAWAFPELFVQSLSVGAPPDQFSHEGQSWGAAPVSPRALRATGFDYWRQLLQHSFEHGGMLRVDHVMGLWRQFWIPDGMSPGHGAYVEYPARELLGVLALESSRANALVVGEDLGLVPAMVRPELERQEILASRVLYFEREPDSGYTAPVRYPKLSLAMANTHDLPTLAGWWMGADIFVDVSGGGGGATGAAVEDARAQREADRGKLVEALALGSFLAAADAEALLALPLGGAITDAERRLLSAFVRAAHALVCSGNSALVSLSLDDLALEVEQVNRPGVPMTEWASWSRKMRLTIADIAAQV